MPRKSSHSYETSTSEGADRIALGAAFFLGAGGSIALKVTDLHPGLVALWSASVLFGYVLAIWRVGNLRIEPETTGDNCYYLGFVFTLTSLAVTLYQMSGAEVGQDTLRDVISGFGIALSSTIVGIVLRVWLMRLRPDIVARDREARIELHTMVREFRIALADSTATIKAYSIESSQLMGEERAKLGRLSGEAIETHRESMRKGAELQMEVLERTISEGAEKTAASIASTIERALEASSGTFSESVAGIRAEIADFIRVESETMRRVVTNSTRASEGGTEIHEALSKVSELLDLLARRLEDASGTVAEKLTKASETIEMSSASATRQIEESFSKLGDAAQQLANAGYHQRAAKALEEHLVTLERGAARLSEIVQSFERDAIDRAVTPSPAIPVRSSTAAGISGVNAPKSESEESPMIAPDMAPEPTARPKEAESSAENGQRRFGWIFGKKL